MEPTFLPPWRFAGSSTLRVTRREAMSTRDGEDVGGVAELGRARRIFEGRQDRDEELAFLPYRTVIPFEYDFDAIGGAAT